MDSWLFMYYLTRKYRCEKLGWWQRPITMISCCLRAFCSLMRIWEDVVVSFNADEMQGLFVCMSISSPPLFYPIALMLPPKSRSFCSQKVAALILCVSFSVWIRRSSEIDASLVGIFPPKQSPSLLVLISSKCQCLLQNVVSKKHRNDWNLP